MSHWPVETNAAEFLTTTTIAALKKEPSIGRAEALRRTMLAMIGSREPTLGHPAMWAPFMVVGAGGAAL